jgi:chorismate dehydratase
MPGSVSRPVRIGAVSYLNSKPLIEGLQELAEDAELILDYPSRLAEDLAAGKLDVALVPSIECMFHPEYRIVSDACVATRGPVLSVKLFSRVEVGKIRSLALDEGSRTSSMLVRILLSERYGIEPILEPLPLGCAFKDTTADAILLIGDRAIHPPEEQFQVTWDLGVEWTHWTGLPFVFALWLARPDCDLAGVEEALSQARDRGLENLAQIACRESDKLGIPEKTAYDYLKKNLCFRLGPAEENGLKLFHQLAANRNLAPCQPGSEESNVPLTTR